MMDDFEFYVNKLKKPDSYKEPPWTIASYKSVPIVLPYTNRQVTLAKNSIMWSMRNAPAREVDKALVALLKRDPDFYDRVMDRLEVDYHDPHLIKWLRSWARGKVVSDFYLGEIEGR